jgi:23S rRNA (cytosine1962-C5)-methyltransferase
MKVLTLRQKKDRSLFRYHPWIFDSAIGTGRADSGELVRVNSADGDFLAWASFSPLSKIRARIWSFEQSTRIDASFFETAIAHSIKRRDHFIINSNGVRLIHAESDGIPALIVDRYDDVLVVQFGASGVERYKSEILDALVKVTGIVNIYERSDAASRSLEGLPLQTGWLRGGGSTKKQLQEHDWILDLDIATGHKTGFYLDQRDNRAKVHSFLRGRNVAQVLNCHCYSGGFTIAALAAGAQHVTSIDSSGPALDLARANVALNGFDAERTTFVEADVNKSLRAYIEQGRRFDAIVLDPPKFAPTASHVERAARAYKDINRLALQLLNPGGFLFTFSCSGSISVDLFHKIVAGSGIDAKVNAFVIDRMAAGADHPLSLFFPEGEYLKGLVLMRCEQ